MTRRTDREALAAAREVLEPHGFDLSISHAGKHPHIVAYRDGATYLLAYCNTPRIEGSVTDHTRQKARAVLRGVYRSVTA